MIKLSQRDPKWCIPPVYLGPSTCTVYQFGCTTTCISMFSDYFNEFKNPMILARSLEYTKEGYLLWNSIGRVFKGFQFKWRFYTFDKAIIAEALKNPAKTVLLNVDGGKHWVAAVRAIPFTKTYWVHDPWDGKAKLYGGVVGGAVLIKK